MNLHNYKSNRLELLNTKDRGTIITSVKNIDTVADIEKEIFEKLKDNNGENAVFIYWHEGKSYLSNYTLTGLKPSTN